VAELIVAGPLLLIRDCLKAHKGIDDTGQFGLLVGEGFDGLAVLLERAAYPGLLDFSTSYRATATFWEMHVGGAASDACLALATPFAAWALWSARSRFGCSSMGIRTPVRGSTAKSAARCQGE